MERDFEEALAGAVRQARERAGRRQEDLATEARRWGFSWSPATVAAIETGRRHISASELFLLPIILRAPGAEPVELDDLLGGLGRIRLSPDAITTGETLGLVAKGQASRAFSEGTWDVPFARNVRAAVKAAGEWLERYRQVFPNLRVRDLVAAEEESGGEAERHAGYRLGCTSVDVAIAARNLWGRSLTAERDRRAAPGASPQARGRITRQLLDELAPLIEEVRGGSH